MNICHFLFKLHLQHKGSMTTQLWKHTWQHEAYRDLWLTLLMTQRRSQGRKKRGLSGRKYNDWLIKWRHEIRLIIDTDRHFDMLMDWIKGLWVFNPIIIKISVMSVSFIGGRNQSTLRKPLFFPSHWQTSFHYTILYQIH